jgi:hypothetical protein
MMEPTAEPNTFGLISMINVDDDTPPPVKAPMLCDNTIDFLSDLRESGSENSDKPVNKFKLLFGCSQDSISRSENGIDSQKSVDLDESVITISSQDERARLVINCDTCKLSSDTPGAGLHEDFDRMAQEDYIAMKSYYPLTKDLVVYMSDYDSVDYSSLPGNDVSRTNTLSECEQITSTSESNTVDLNKDATTKAIHDRKLSNVDILSCEVQNGIISSDDMYDGDDELDENSDDSEGSHDILVIKHYFVSPHDRSLSQKQVDKSREMVIVIDSDNDTLSETTVCANGVIVIDDESDSSILFTD